MTIPNETKIGAMAAVAIVMLILGFNFLKGKNLFKQKNKLYAVFTSVEELNTADAVRINGLQVGNVTEIEEMNPEVNSVIVTIGLTKNINIPDDSYLVIKPNPLSSTTLSIVKGTSATYFKNGDTLKTKISKSIVDEAKSILGPTMEQVSGTLKSLDSLIEILGTVFDPEMKKNIASSVSNLNASTANLNDLLQKNGALDKTIQNFNAISGNIKNNNDTINRILANASSFSSQLKSIKLSTTIASIDNSAEQLNTMLKKINDAEGTLGALINDKKLYSNLNNTTTNLTLLLQDLRIHPKRYVNISVFGKKDKSGPLMKPLEDSTINVPISNK
jgi:phospholipid/cholesterol/gamma-HCH transport system substrate-binding protein